MKNTTNNIDLTDLDNVIHALKTFANEARIKPLISILEAIKEDSDNESLLAQLTETWRGLGVYQGTVLTYVPHFYTWIPDDIFGDNLN